MSVIKDLNAITEYRNRRQSRIDQRREDDEWKTINGTHVMVDEGGQITRGPEKLKSLGNDALKPSRTDYDYDPSDGFQDFVHKNVEKARPIYEEKGMEGVEDEWYKTRLRNSTKDLKEIGDDEIDRILDKYVSQATARMWLVEYNNDIKPKLVQELTANSEVRNACLNIMYENYKDTGGKLSFKDFLLTPIKMYRGGSGKEYKKASAFSSYTLDRKAAEKFKNGPTGHEPEKDGEIYEAEIRPIDTYGSLNTSGEMEILVPRMIAPNGRRDSRADEKDWNEELNITGFGIEPTVASAKPNRITDVKLSSDMRPSREYIFLDSKGKILGHRDWLKANRRALQKLYEQGEDKVDQDYYKGLMVNASRRLKRVPDAEVIRDENYEEAKNDGFFRRKLIEGILKNKKARNAALNIMYDNYCKAVHGCMTFEEFLNTPIKMNKISDGDVFSSYGFMSDGDELTIRPIDTFGSIRPIPNAAVMIPWWRTKGEAVRNEDRWEWERPERYVFEEKLAPMPEAELLDAIKGEAEVIKLFSDDESETGKAVIERCTDSIHRYLRRLVLRSQESHTDSAFFSGELNGQLGERNILYPEIGEYQARKKARLDAKDAIDWITVNGNHIPVDEDGNPVGGQVKALGEQKSEGDKTAKKMSASDAERISKDYGETSKRLGKAKDELRSAKTKSEELVRYIEFSEQGRLPDCEGDYSRAQNEWEKIKSGKSREELEKEKKRLEDKGLSESIFINSLTGKPPSEDSLDRERWEKTILANAEEVTGAKMPEQGTEEYDGWKKAMLGTFSHEIGSAVASKLRPSLMQKLNKIGKIQKEFEAMDKVDAAKEELDKEKDRCALLKRKLADCEAEVQRLSESVAQDEKKMADGSEEWKTAVNTRFPTYNDCKSADDIEEKLRANGCVAHDKKVDLNGVQIDAAKMAGNAIDEFYQKIPMAKGKLGSIIARPMDSATYAGSVSGGFGDEVYLNSDENHFGNTEKLKEAYQRDVKKKFHPDGTGEDLILKHELAHKLDSYLTRTLKKDAVGDECKDISTLVLEEVSEKLGIDEYDVKAEVSGYARKRAVGDWDWISPSRNLQKQGHFSGKDLEFYAEALGEYLSSPNPRRVAVEVWNATQKYLKQAEEREGVGK